MIKFALPFAYLVSSLLIAAAAIWLLPHCKDKQIAKELRINAIVHVVCSIMISTAYILAAVTGVH